MFEAVGEQYWSTYFSQIKNCLTEKGRAVVQTITMHEAHFDEYRASHDFIRNYIFPGGMLPSKTVFNEHVERVGLQVADQYSFGQDYAHTLKAWLDRFDGVRDDVLDLGFDEYFIRLWRFYLASCIAGFRDGRTDVMQVELQHA